MKMRIERLRRLKGYLAYCGSEQLKRLAPEWETRRCGYAFREYCPPRVHENCRLLLFRNGELVIYTDQAHWATWLRNRQERLQRELCERGVVVERIRIVNCPRIDAGPRGRADAPPRPPADAARLVGKVSESISDAGLRSALERLSKRLHAASARDD